METAPSTEKTLGLLAEAILSRNKHPLVKHHQKRNEFNNPTEKSWGTMYRKGHPDAIANFLDNERQRLGLKETDIAHYTGGLKATLETRPGLRAAYQIAYTGKTPAIDSAPQP